MSHTIHPDSHDHGLADDCPRCAEHAENPLVTLDDRNVRALVDRAIRWDADDADSTPRSETERAAMEHVIVQLHRTAALFREAPDATTAYLAARWRMDVRRCTGHLDDARRLQHDGDTCTIHEDASEAGS